MRAGRYKPWAHRYNQIGLAVATVLLYLSYFLHLRADFPNGSRWNDFAKFTDEGWYGGAALHHALTGHWYVPNGFNPAVGLPGWPLLLLGWFDLTGPGMAEARVLTVLLLGGSLAILFQLLRPICGTTGSLLAAFLVLANPFVFSFHRLAILEPLVIFLFMLGLWLATVAGRRTARNARADGQQPIGITVRGSIAIHWPEGLLSLCIGVLIAGMALTKTTSVVLAPAILYQLWASAVLPGWAQRARNGYGASHSSRLLIYLDLLWKDRAALFLPALATLSAAALWSSWYLLWVRPRYLPDYRELFVINNGHAHGRILLQVMARALGDTLWINAVLLPLAMLVVAASVTVLRRLWSIPLYGSSVLALAGSIGFIGWHTWFQPRYYLVCVLPAAMVLAMGGRALEVRWIRHRSQRGWRVAHALVDFAVVVAAASMLERTLHDISQPEYTLLGAANAIAVTIRAEPAHRPVLLSSSGDNISLFTGIHAVNPEWPMGGLATLTRQERPGWYAAYTPWDDRHVAEVAALYRMHPVARYRVFDDPDHQALILYRLYGPR